MSAIPLVFFLSISLILGHSLVSKPSTKAVNKTVEAQLNDVLITYIAQKH